MRALIASALLFAGPLSSVAQTSSAASPPTATLSVTTRLVVLDMTVTDSRGIPVTNLTRDDIRIFEDKAPQTIRSFEPPSAHAPPAASADASAANLVRSSADLPRIGQAPITLLVLDELNMSFGDEVYAREQVERWLAAQPPTLAQPTMLLAVTYKDLHLLADTTQDRDTLASTLKKHYAVYPWRKINAGTVGGTASDIFSATLGALEQIAESTRGVPGRKNVVWVGDGFPTVPRDQLAAENARSIDALLRTLSGDLLMARITLSVLGPTVKPPNHPTNVETQDDYLAGITDFSTLPLGGDFQFADLAPPTGGKAYRGRNDLAAELSEITTAAGSYYTVSYTPTNTSDDPKQYRRIHVELLRPGLSVQTRDGYFAAPLRDPSAPAVQPSREELAFDMLGAARSTLPYTGLHLSPNHIAPSRWQFSVPASELGWHHRTDGRIEAEDAILAVCFSAKGQVLGRSVHNSTSDSAATEVQLLGREATLETSIDPPPGTAHIRFVVRDAYSGRVGTADAAP